MKKAILSVLLLLGLALFIMGCGKQEAPVDVDSLAEGGADEESLLAVEDAEAELGDDEALVAEGSGAIAGQAVKAGNQRRARVEYLSCEDSDGGKNKDVAGYVEYKLSYSGREGTRVVTDRYYSGNGRLYERYCAGNRYRSRFLSCENGAEEVDLTNGRKAWQCSALPMAPVVEEAVVDGAVAAEGEAQAGLPLQTCNRNSDCGDAQTCRPSTPSTPENPLPQKYCQAVGSSGEACTFDSNCASELRCAGNVADSTRFTCVARLESGAVCTAEPSVENPCVAGTFCTPEGTGNSLGAPGWNGRRCRAPGGQGYCEIAAHCGGGSVCAGTSAANLTRMCRSNGSAPVGSYCDRSGRDVCAGGPDRCDLATNMCT